jgi:serine/threonine protein phosphatase PrpC
MPDSIADGWSTDHFTLRLASVRGYAHRYGATSRQDDAAAAVDPSTGTVVIAVADGVSSAPHSHVGAAIACHTAVNCVLHQLASPADKQNWTLVMQAVAAALAARGRELLRDPDAASEAIEKLLATTLVVGCVMPTSRGPVAALARVGDSGGWVLYRGRYHPVLAEKNQPGQQVISSAVTPLPRVPARVTQVRLPLRPGAVLLIGTDGFGDPLGDGTGLVGHQFAEHLREPPPALALAHLLDFSRETFDDDRTLVAVWPRLPERQPKG